MEDKHYHITASTRGFYVNHSTEEEFNPKPANPSYLSHSLIELLNQVDKIHYFTCPIYYRNINEEYIVIFCLEKIISKKFLGQSQGVNL